jgi:hypothetical protein
MSGIGNPTVTTPSSLDEFRQWLRDMHGVLLDDKTRNLSNTNTTTILNTVQEHAFFQRLPELLGSYSDEYRKNTGARLFMGDELYLQLVPKPYESMVNKSYRLNVVRNKGFPKPPKVRIANSSITGWVVPGNWHERVDDCVRGTLTLRYMDGPMFVAQRLAAAATAAGVTAVVSPRALDEGYYAYHLYVALDVPILKEDWSSRNASIWIEIQLTTQFQELARELTHGFYEQQRMERERDDAWKWDYSSDRFRAAYLGHALHLLEGIVVNLRDSLRGSSARGSTLSVPSPSDEE